MPKEDYRGKQLSRSYANELFRQIEASDLPVAGFELTQRAVKSRPLPGTILDGLLGPRRNVRLVTVIKHSGSRSWFQIMQLAEERFLCEDLTDSAVPAEEEVFYFDWLSRRVSAVNWAVVTHLVAEWLKQIKVIEDSQKEPDLWEQLKQGRTFLGGEHEQDVENSPFTSDEQAEVSAQIKQVKDYIKTAFELTSEQIVHVDSRFEQAEQASRHMGRKDWLLLFNGAVFSLILTDLITPQAAQHVLTLTIHGLGHLFGVGGPPPHLPPVR